MADDGPYPCPECHGEGCHYDCVGSAYDCRKCHGTGQAERPPQTSRSGSFVQIEMEEEDKKRG